MRETSKTNRKIFEEKYAHEELIENPLKCAEAIGYLKALIEYFPSEKNWADSYIETLLMVVLFHLL